MTNRMDDLAKTISIYRSVDPRERAWGMVVTGVGFRRVPARTRYEFGPLASAEARRRGRVMPEFAAIYLTRGEGTFESEASGSCAVVAGDLFLLFPGVWHDYRPRARTGWDEHWVIFHGDQPERLLAQNIIAPERCVFRPGLDETVHQLFSRMIVLAETQGTGSGPLLAALVSELLASALARQETRQQGQSKTAPAMQRARCHLAEHCEGEVDMDALARSLHLSYRHFRRLFREATGLAPQQYHLQLRVNRAKLLLEDGRLSVQEVAARLGFEDPLYFSRLFRQKTGVAPSRWRR